MLKKISQEKIGKQRNLYTYLHRPVLPAEDLKAQFESGRVNAQVSYEEDLVQELPHGLSLATEAVALPPE